MHYCIRTIKTSHYRRVFSKFSEVFIYYACRPAVPVTDITKYLLASVSSLEDVISLITSHTEYQLDTETHVSYNLHNVEHDMRLKYAGAKAKIKAGSEEFNALSYVFKEDFNMWSQIDILRPKQVSITLLRRLLQ